MNPTHTPQPANGWRCDVPFHLDGDVDDDGYQTFNAAELFWCACDETWLCHDCLETFCATDDCAMSWDHYQAGMIGMNTALRACGKNMPFVWRALVRTSARSSL